MIAAFTTVISACNAKPVIRTTNPADTGNAPVETRKPNSDYKPAFAGQTRAPGVKTVVPLTVTVINKDLQSPGGFVFCRMAVS